MFKLAGHDTRQCHVPSLLLCVCVCVLRKYNVLGRRSLMLLLLPLTLGRSFIYTIRHAVIGRLDMSYLNPMLPAGTALL